MTGVCEELPFSDVGMRSCGEEGWERGHAVVMLWDRMTKMPIICHLHTSLSPDHPPMGGAD